MKALSPPPGIQMILLLNAGGDWGRGVQCRMHSWISFIYTTAPVCYFSILSVSVPLKKREWWKVGSGQTSCFMVFVVTSGVTNGSTLVKLGSRLKSNNMW